MKVTLDLPCVFAVAAEWDLSMLRKAINRVTAGKVRYRMFPDHLYGVGQHQGYYRAVFFVGDPPKNADLPEIMAQKGVTLV